MRARMTWRIASTSASPRPLSTAGSVCIEGRRRGDPRCTKIDTATATCCRRACGPRGHHGLGFHAPPPGAVLHAAPVQPRRGRHQDRGPATRRLHAIGASIIHEVSYPFAMVNRGKRSLAVDLKTVEGQEILRKLARRADVVVEQFRPGVMARLGADYDALAMWNPKLIYCSFSGYGQDGPYKDLPGHDINFEALAGLLSVTRSLDERRPAIPGVPIADLAGGFNAALAILASLRTRDRTGRGEFIDVSIYDTAVTLLVLGLARYLATGEEPMPGETLLTGSFPFYSLYETKDGQWLSVATVEPKFWERMCELIGAPELSGKQFAEPDERPAS